MLNEIRILFPRPCADCGMPIVPPVHECAFLERIKFMLEVDYART